MRERSIYRKVCTRCADPKPISEFYRHPHGADGYESVCKTCKRATVLLHHHRNMATDPAYRERRRLRSRESYRNKRARFWGDGIDGTERPDASREA